MAINNWKSALPLNRSPFLCPKLVVPCKTYAAADKPHLWLNFCSLSCVCLSEKKTTSAGLDKSSSKVTESDGSSPDYITHNQTWSDYDCKCWLLHYAILPSPFLPPTTIVSSCMNGIRWHSRPRCANSLIFLVYLHFNKSSRWLYPLIIWFVSSLLPNRSQVIHLPPVEVSCGKRSSSWDKTGPKKILSRRRDGLKTTFTPLTPTSHQLFLPVQPRRQLSTFLLKQLLFI